MKITLTNKQAEAAIIALRKIGENEAIDGFVAYKIAKILNKLRTELTVYFEAKQKIIDAYAEDVSPAGTVTKWKDAETAMAEFSLLSADEISVEYKQLEEDDFAKLQCSVQEAVILSQFTQNDEDENDEEEK